MLIYLVIGNINYYYLKLEFCMFCDLMIPTVLL
jgi:hypothetical protein